MGLAKSKERKEALRNWIPERKEPCIGEQRVKAASIPEKKIGKGPYGMFWGERFSRNEEEPAQT